MSSQRKIGRKTFLASALAAYSTVTLGGCSDDNAGDTQATGGTDTGGSATGGSATGGSATGGSEAGGSGGAGAGSGTSGSGGTSGGSSAGSAGSSSDSGGEGGGGDGGTFLCITETGNGMHSHPLAVPSSDVERGSQEAAYVLEDGGTGHTHTVSLSDFDFAYLQSGMEVRVQSSISEDHRHLCIISCARG